MQQVTSSMAKPRYHIFLSYRREDGKDIARTLKETLAGKGYRVFLDMDELQDGVFDERILAAIDAAPIYMLIMTAHCFDRCHNVDDWVRQELEYAIRKGKTIIPINPDKQFVDYPATMPQHLKDSLSSHQYSAVDTGQLYQDSISKLIKQRIHPALRPLHIKYYTMAVIGVFVALLALLGVLLLRHYRAEQFMQKAEFYLKGDHTILPDTEMAIYFYQRAIKNGATEAYIKIADIYQEMALHAEWEEYQMYEDSVWRYTLLGAYAGDPEAQYQLADDYATESFNDHYDLDSAYYWAKSAYNQGHQAATSLYANCYIQGWGVDLDPQKGEDILRKAVAEGNTIAQTTLGCVLVNGTGVTNDYVGGMYHLVQAYKKDKDMTSHYNLRQYTKWLFEPEIEQTADSTLRLRAIGWTTYKDNVEFYFEWYNKNNLLTPWMRLDSILYLENATTGERYPIGYYDGCKFAPDSVPVKWGDTHRFMISFINVPDSAVLNFVKSDSSTWKLFGIHTAGGDIIPEFDSNDYLQIY